MFTRKQIDFYSVLLAISALVFWYSTFAAAESMNYKFNTQLVRVELVPDDDVDGHVVYLIVEDIIFESGEAATINDLATSAHIKGAGPFIQNVSLKFADGSTITTKRQGTIRTTTAGTGALCDWTSEIIKGSGRFEGIKGSQKAKATYLPVEKGEIEREMNGEGTIIYTLPPK